MRIISRLKAVAVIAVIAAASMPAAAQYPSRPISVVIPFAPGGSTDNEARLYTDKVSKSLGQPLVFDFRAGAASSIGVAYALKAAPDGYTLLLTGAGGITHTVCASMALSMGIPITAVHYKGVALGQADLMAGRTQISGGTLFQAMPHIKRGAVRAIAVFGKDRSRLMPQLLTTSEQGIDLDYPSWLGAFAPPGTPGDIIARLHGEFVKAVNSPDVVQILEKQGSLPIGSTPAEFARKMDSELAYWKDVIEKANIKL